MNVGDKLIKSPIRFAQGWEDHKVIEEGLNIKKGHVLAGILASGDNILNFIRFEPSKIYAFDISHAQIFEVKLKLTALEHLNHTEFITLLGYNGTDIERQEIYGVNLNLSLGKRTTSLMLFFPVMTIRNLSIPRPQPACGGIPHEKTFRWVKKSSNLRLLSIILFSNLFLSETLVPPDASSRLPYIKSKDSESSSFHSFDSI